jgi:NDP-sugar pyrophosphorylase family protein
MATHYKWDKIAQHFGDGSIYGIEISYLIEDSPLGTAGALSLLEPSDEPLLVINGDVLTRLDLRAMLAFHEDHRAAMTVAVKEYHLQVPYGVIATNEAHVVDLSEKPTLRFFVNAGVYLLSPEAQRRVPQGRPYDMTDLIKDLISAGQCVVSFPIQEYWLDIGQLEDYEQAQQDMAAGVV